MNEQEMAVKLAEVDARSKSNTHRLDKIEKEFEALNKLATAMEVMANEQKHIAETITTMEDNLDTLKKEVKTIEEKPAKRWDGMVDKFLYGMAGALAAALAGGLIYLLTVAVAKLGVINSPDYWQRAAASGKVKYLDRLLIKAAVKITKTGTRTATPEEGVAALVAAGVVNTPDYWLANYRTFPSLDALLCALGGAVK